ncbi:MAG: DEAD/DEAH box helicase [Planctomycetia bacterium]|nr:DEAD/DEAH box helicase [Planctomycetia bacterium]
MTSLEKRLFHLFDRAEVARARALQSVRVSCPRVGQVRAVVTDEAGQPHDLVLELSAGRRGGMTIESRCSGPEGRAGRPCALLAAALLEIDRRGLFSTIHDHTPVALEVVPAADDEPGGDDGAEPAADAADVSDRGGSSANRITARTAMPRGQEPHVTVARRSPARQPSWASELEDRRRLVEPALRTRALAIADGRRSSGALVFLLDLSASADAHAAVLVPSRIQLDVAGNATGRPRPIVLGPNETEFDQLDPQERGILAQLIGSVALGEAAAVEPLERRSVARIAVSPQSAAAHLSMLCETGRLVVQPEPRKAPDHVVPLAWDGGRPWEFALVLEPDDEAGPRAETLREMGDAERSRPRPGKATLRGMLVRGSQRKDLRDPRAILRSGLVVFADRLARLAVPDAGGGPGTALNGWMEQFERRGPIELAGSQADGLIERLASLADVPRLELPAWTGWRIESGSPRPRLVLDDSPAISDDGSGGDERDAVAPRPTARRRTGPRVQLAGRIWFDYGGVQIAADDPAGGAADAARRIFVRRDRAAEREAIAMLPRYGATAPRPDADDDRVTTHHVEIPRARLDASVSQLAAAGWAVEVAGRRYRPAGSVAWNVTSGIDWFELSGTVDFGGVSAEMPALLEALARGERAIELPDGSLGILPESMAAQFEPLMTLAQKHDGRLRYGRIQVALLDALLAGQPQSRVDEAFEKIRDELARGERPEAENEPDGFVGTLRHYQREGLGWLAFLERMGLGGCLADDMGLGKTIQVLAMLVRRQSVVRESGIAHRPSLVIVPKSLVFNWMEEAQRFAPSLRVLNHTGNDRAEQSESLAGWDLVLTTYGTLRRDIVRHRDVEFDYVVLDEAQSIKNAGSQAAKACRLLSARHRLAVTGTPVENHIGELWSIFEFLNPGQLGSAARLKRFLVGGRGSSEVVARAVRPYLLRRTKAQVLSDLPEKTEQTLFCEMGESQRKAYDDLRNHYRLELAGRIGRMGIGRSRIAVLEALLRLRQTACHPGLIDPARIDEPGAKLEALLEQLGEVLDEGHKVLVFSQFTSFLAILRRHLESRSMPYEYLDGKTTDRQSRVARFQEDPECRLFLISLKAGGQGLNLTAADYIYILDPWWNPAVEAQAVDRAHRIGQTRRVFAYRLIARDTVEEKILALQDRKRELAESIVRADEGMIASLTAEDVELLLS